MMSCSFTCSFLFNFLNRLAWNRNSSMIINFRTWPCLPNLEHESIRKEDGRPKTVGCVLLWRRRRCKPILLLVLRRVLVGNSKEGWRKNISWEAALIFKLGSFTEALIAKLAASTLWSSRKSNARRFPANKFSNPE